MPPPYRPRFRRQRQAVPDAGSSWCRRPPPAARRPPPAARRTVPAFGANGRLYPTPAAP